MSFKFAWTWVWAFISFHSFYFFYICTYWTISVFHTDILGYQLYRLIGNGHNKIKNIGEYRSKVLSAQINDIARSDTSRLLSNISYFICGVMLFSLLIVIYYFVLSSNFKGLNVKFGVLWAVILFFIFFALVSNFIQYGVEKLVDTGKFDLYINDFSLKTDGFKFLCSAIVLSLSGIIVVSTIVFFWVDLVLIAIFFDVDTLANVRENFLMWTNRSNL